MWWNKKGRGLLFRRHAVHQDTELAKPNESAGDDRSVRRSQYGREGE
jgi:hypothetical protein